jgi:hypothetical protein
MLRKSIPIFRIGLIVCLVGTGLYFYNEDYGKYILGAGMVLVSVSMVLYVFFMFKRYGEKRRT